jgi:hypothetical protein
MTGRDHAWLRSKTYVGMDRPGADANGYEKWPRYCAEIPPELAEELDAAQRESLGVNQSGATRAGVVRAGLRMYLNATAPEREAAIEGTAVDITDEPQAEIEA